MNDYRTPRESVRGLSRPSASEIGDRIIGYVCAIGIGFILGMLLSGY